MLGPAPKESPLRFVCSLAFAPLDQLLALARAADAAGFEAAAVSDHVVHPQKIATPYPYTADGAPRWEPFTAWPDPWVAIGAMAAVTSRLRFLTSIYVLPLRSPLLVAKAVATAAVLSGGRVTLGVGAGWMREEFVLMEQPFEGRGRRMDEMIELLRALWAGGCGGAPRGVLRLRPPRDEPRSRRARADLGGRTRGARAAPGGPARGRLDLGPPHDGGAARDRRAARARRADSERAGRPFAVCAAVKDAFDLDGYRRAADAGVTHLQTMPWLFYPGGGATLESKCDGIRRFGEEIVAKLAEAP